VHSPSWELIVAQLVKKFSALDGTRNLFTVFKRGRHWSYSELDESSLHYISWRYTLVLACCVRWGLQCDLFPSCFHTKLLYVYVFLSGKFYVLPISSSSNRPNTILWRIQIIKLFILQLYPTCCYCFSLKSKYSLQNSVTKNVRSLYRKFNLSENNEVHLMKSTVFWDVKPCILVEFYAEYRRNILHPSSGSKQSVQETRGKQEV
jgi:hypothetical protein